MILFLSPARSLIYELTIYSLKIKLLIIYVIAGGRNFEKIKRKELKNDSKRKRKTKTI